MTRKWMVDVYLETEDDYEDEDVERLVAETLHLMEGVVDLAVSGVTDWGSNTEEEEPYDPDGPVTIIDATPPRLTLVKSDRKDE